MSSERASRLAGLRGVVVGGGSGIGRATSIELVSNAARVVVADIDGAKAASVAAEADPTGKAVYGENCDVRLLGSLEALRDKAVALLGGIDFLAVTVGVTQSGGIVDADASQWEGLLATNVLGLANTLRAFLPALKKADAGIAVVVSSLSGRETYAGQPLYIASKWASVGLAHSVRKEAQEAGVRVTLLTPGLVDTPMSRNNPYAQKIFEAVEPLQPDDLARAVRFVLEQPKHVLIRELALQPVQQCI